TDQLTLPSEELLGLLSRIAALALLRLQRQLDEAGAQALDLVLDGGTDIVGLDDGPQPAGGGDRLQAGDARAQHKHAGWRDRPGRRDQEGEEFAQPVGGD